MTETMTPKEQAAKWLETWDSGGVVHTIEMGGMGPGYEQAIQMQAAEILRTVLRKNLTDDDFSEEKWPEVRDSLEAGTSIVEGLTGAQWGVAMRLALFIYRRGTDAFENAAVKDRRIMASRHIPNLKPNNSKASGEMT